MPHCGLLATAIYFVVVPELLINAKCLALHCRCFNEITTTALVDTLCIAYCQKLYAFHLILECFFNACWRWKVVDCTRLGLWFELIKKKGFHCTLFYYSGSCSNLYPSSSSSSLLRRHGNLIAIFWPIYFFLIPHSLLTDCENTKEEKSWSSFSSLPRQTTE